MTENKYVPEIPVNGKSSNSIESYIKNIMTSYVNLGSGVYASPAGNHLVQISGNQVEEMSFEGTPVSVGGVPQTEKQKRKIYIELRKSAMEVA